jgi:hypothetical protein
MTQPATAAGLEASFKEWTQALNTANLAVFWGYFHEDCETLDEDYPWRMTKAEFVDHIAFHTRGQGLWEFFEWLPREVNYRVWGTTGHTSGFSTFRGKPRDDGFRQRFMGFTQTWVHAGGGWKLVCWHQSPLLGRILNASPT